MLLRYVPLDKRACGPLTSNFERIKRPKSMKRVRNGHAKKTAACMIDLRGWTTRLLNPANWYLEEFWMVAGSGQRLFGRNPLGNSKPQLTGTVHPTCENTTDSDCCANIIYIYLYGILVSLFLKLYFICWYVLCTVHVLHPQETNIPKMLLS